VRQAEISAFLSTTGPYLGKGLLSILIMWLSKILGPCRYIRFAAVVWVIQCRVFQEESSGANEVGFISREVNMKAGIWACRVQPAAEELTRL